jgi:DNA repair protein RecO (recombination protein O)
MPKTYKVVGINLKGMPLGESDRLLTVLTPEEGLIRVVAPRSRSHRSKLGGRSELFVVNHLLLASGRSLDKIVQADTIESFPGLSYDLRKLTAGQYLAELALLQAVAGESQTELFQWVTHQLRQIEALPGQQAIAVLVQATVQLLTLAGVSPQVRTCGITQQSISPNFCETGWRIGFSPAVGGIVQLDHLSNGKLNKGDRPAAASSMPSLRRVTEPRSSYAAKTQSPTITQLGAPELTVLQQLVQPSAIAPDGRLMSLESPEPLESVGSVASVATPLATVVEAAAVLAQPISTATWLMIERALRHYAQYYFERPIRSAELIDTCFTALNGAVIDRQDC